MDPAIIARALHVLGVVLWIGGVAFVTTVLLPAVRRLKAPEERVEFFETLERRFAWQARGTTLLVGATGFHLVAAWDLWGRFANPAYWWMHAMVAGLGDFHRHAVRGRAAVPAPPAAGAVEARPGGHLPPHRADALGVAGDQPGDGARRRGRGARLGVLIRPPTCATDGR